MECFICGQKGASEDELEKHMQAVHIDQVQTLNCVKCNFVAKDSDSMKDHEAGFIHNGIVVPQNISSQASQNKSSQALPNLPSQDKPAKCKNGNRSECRWAWQEKCRFDHSDESAPNVAKVKECIHGNACRWKAQGRCTYYHVDVGVQSVRRPRAKQSPRPVPTHQWQIMPPRQQQGQQQNGNQASHANPPQPRNQRYEMPSMQQKSQQQSCTAPPPSIPPQAWCSYGRTCNQGWRCSLRHFSDQDFLNLQRQVTN